MHKTIRFVCLAVLIGVLASLLFFPRLAFAADKAETRAKIRFLLQDRLAVLQTIQHICRRTI